MGNKRKGGGYHQRRKKAKKDSEYGMLTSVLAQHLVQPKQPLSRMTQLAQQSVRHVLFCLVLCCATYMLEVLSLVASLASAIALRWDLTRLRSKVFRVALGMRVCLCGGSCGHDGIVGRIVTAVAEEDYGTIRNRFGKP